MEAGRRAGAPLWSGSAEQRQDVLRCLVGDGERLSAELLLHLQRLQLGRGRFHVGVHQRADAGPERVGQARDELVLGLNPAGRRTELRRGVDRGLVRDIELKRSAFSPTSRSAACPVAKSREPTSTIIALVASCLAT